MKVLVLVIIAFCAGYFTYPLFPRPSDKLESFTVGEAKTFAEAKLTPSKPVAVSATTWKTCPPADAKIPAPLEAPVMTGSPEALSETPNQKVEKNPQTPEARWAKYATTPYLDSFKGADQRILGRFEGSLFRKNNTDAITMSFNLVQNDKIFEGDVLVTMADSNGKEYSRNAGNGGNHSIKKAGENSYYIEVSPTSYFLVNMKHYPQLTGKYFERGKFVGDVQLRKLTP